jgi:hypothetical protein
VTVPGGSVDYCLVSVRDGKVKDFVGIELQTLDTTGTAWPERQRFLQANGLKVDPADAASTRKFGMNWKHTAKTILGQLHHKVATFDHLGKRFVLVLQGYLLEYLRGAYAFDHIRGQRDGDPMQFHVYESQTIVRDQGSEGTEWWSPTSADEVARSLPPCRPQHGHWTVGAVPGSMVAPLNPCGLWPGAVAAAAGPVSFGQPTAGCPVQFADGVAG